MMKTHETPPAYTNALAKSASLYLRQHAHNPVMWYPWGDEAFELAKKHDRPILLSIGYSSCYWCHVMEREVFENVSIASYMNANFINIKVDREELPLVDESYMVARQLLTREGGWPNNVFLTPQLNPFFACGTQLAEDSPQRPSFTRLLEWLNAKWHSEREQIEKESTEINRLTKRFLSLRQAPENAPDLPLSSLVHTLTDQLIGAHDDIQGGFFKAPKFPHETYLAYLLYVGEQFTHKPALDIAISSMLKMAAGGIYDQVGCGFHRYAIDKHWYVPHFEKMLYNQALCASVYTKATALSNNPFLADVAQGTLEFVSGPMRSKHGPFFASIDAETDGVEGAYYSWTPEEILDVLSEEEGAFFQHYYALADIPHFPGHKPPAGQAVILRKPLWAAARDEGRDYLQLAALSGQILNKLLNVRNQRQAPVLDDKIITSWNGLMIKAYAEGYAQFKNSKLKDAAIGAARYFYMRYKEHGELAHTYREFKAVSPAVLEDYAYLADGIAHVAMLCEDNSLDWQGFTKDLLADSKAEFLDRDAGIYRLNSTKSAKSAGAIDIHHATDGALPSAIGVLMHGNLNAYRLTNNAHYLDHVAAVQSRYQPSIQPQGILEYAELLKAFATLQTLRQDADFTREMALLLSEAEPAKSPIAMSAMLAPDSVVEPAASIRLNINITLLNGWSIEALGEANSTTQLLVEGQNIKSISSIGLPDAACLDLGGGDKKQVYQESTQIAVELECSNVVGRHPIEVRLSYQPCDAKQCYARQEKTHIL